MTLWSGIRRFWALTRRDRHLFLEALCCELSAGLIIKIIPFRRIPRFFAARVKDEMNADPGMILEIREAIQRAALISPWKNRCLVQSLAARLMLNRRDIASQLSLGVAHDADNRIIAHAWLVADGFEIVPEAGSYTELFMF